MKTPIHFAARLIILLLFLPILTTAQNGSLPETLFGARSLSLGRSAVVSSHDALAVSWNPAGVMNSKKITVSAAVGNLIVADASHSSFGLVIPTKKYGHVGVNYYQMKIGFTGRDDPGLLGCKSFSL